jgi:hypothetical protein
MPLQRRFLRDLAAFLLGTASLVASPPAGAQNTAPVSTRLSFSSPAGCGSAADFAGRVEQRSSQVHFVQRGATDTLSVRISSRGRGLVAQLTLSSGNKRLTQRSIEAEQCEDALDALALVVVVTLEGRASDVRARRARPSTRPPPRRRETPPTPRETTPSVPAPAQPTPPTTPSPVGTEQPAPTTTPSEPTPPEPTPPEPQPPAEEEPEPPLPPPEPPETPEVVVREPERDEPPSGPSTPLPLYGGLGGGGLLYFGAAPSYLPGWLVYARIGLDRGSAWSPQIIVSYLEAQADGFSQPGYGFGWFRLRAGELDVCPLQLEYGRFAFVPCAFGQIGVLKGIGYGERVIREEHSALWAAAGLNSQFVFNLSVLELRAAASLGSPLNQFAVRFRAPEGSDEPDPALHRVPSVMFSTSISLGLSFR